MATSTRVYAARVAGLPVFGPDGEQIGKVRDLVTALRIGPRPPRVLGLVVELAIRQRIFVPMLRVTSIEPGAVALATGTVSLRRFSLRPNETLVIGEILDARVHVAATGAVAVVVDAGMEQDRTRDWVITTLAVRERTGRRGRRGPVQVLGWDEVSGLTLAEVSSRGQGAEQLLALYEELRAVEVANALRELPTKRRHEVVDALDDERLADVLQELSEDEQAEVLAHLGDERGADVLEAMNPDDAADLLGELAQTERERLLRLMAPEESAPVRRLLAYSSDTAGGLMTPEPVVLTPDATVAEALARVRNPELTPALASMVFVCRPPSATPTGRYLGCAHLQRLLREPPSDLVAGVLDTELARLGPQASLAEVTRYFAAYDLVCAPVVDAEGHLLGAVSVDDLLDAALPDDWRQREAWPASDWTGEVTHG
ncbi:MAG TPA: CBS domain-containing protein [Pseudonocardiaceae bacterium]|nr:CBS domain-containing protein [Pseudonocardiaceae bacterium]